MTLGFPEEQAFLKDVAERRRPELEAGVGAFLGRAGRRPLRRHQPRARRRRRRPTRTCVLAEARRIFADDLVDVGEVS